MSHILKKFTLWTSLLATVSLIVVTPLSSARATSISDLKKQQESLQNEIDAKKDEAAEKQAEANKLENEVANLDGNISATENQISQTEGEVSSVQGQITGVKSEIGVKEKELQVQQANFNQAVVELYRAGRRSNIEKVLGSADLAQAVEQTTYLDSLQEHVNGIVQKITGIKNELETKKSDLETKNEELNGLLAQQESQKSALTAQRSTKEKLREGAEIAAETASKSAIAAESKLGDIIDAIRSSSGGSSGGGGSVGPLVGKDISTGTVVGYMGSTGNSSGSHLHLEVRSGSGEDLNAFYRSSAVNPASNCIKPVWDNGPFMNTSSLSLNYGLSNPLSIDGNVTGCFGYGGYGNGYENEYHGGIDYDSYSGVPIHATKSGRVLYQGWLGLFGNTVVISHGDGLWTLYAHML